MPIFSLSANAALARMRSNKAARWPDGRHDGRRLEGLVLPGSAPNFHLPPGDTVFTAGSCFARNIEARLEALGFAVPARAVTVPENERSSDTANDILNKYNPQSIVNELVWAFEQPFPEDGFLQVAEGLWHDPHLAGNSRPLPLERLRERRAAVCSFFQKLPRCRTLIVTLGLVEAWFDHRTGLHLNAAPPAAAIAREPKRFRFDVLDHDEVLASLERMWALVAKHGHRNARMLATVSPVPLRATHTADDVLVANSYSKSVLRAAVGAFAARHKRVDYFPSYEAATLTARSIAFMEDNRHVAPEMVNAIINQVVRRYIRNPPPAASPAGGPATDDLPIARQVRDHLKMGRNDAARRLLATVARDKSFAASGYDEFQFRYVYGKALATAGALLEALLELQRCVELEPRSAIAQYGLARVLARLQRPLGAEEAFRRATELDPTNVDALLRLARLEARNGKLPDAEQTALVALALAPEQADVLQALAAIRAAVAGEWTADESDRLAIGPDRPAQGRLRGFG